MPKIYEQKYFSYQGKQYGYGTIVKLKSKIYRGITRIENCGGITEFCKGSTNGMYQFRIITNELHQKGGICIDTSLDDAIECIIKPVEVELQPVWENALENYRKMDKHQRPDTLLCTLWYIAAMLVTTIFKDRIGLWIIETFLYLRYLVNKYRD